MSCVIGSLHRTHTSTINALTVSEYLTSVDYVCIKFSLVASSSVAELKNDNIYLRALNQIVFSRSGVTFVLPFNMFKSRHMTNEYYIFINPFTNDLAGMLFFTLP